jgi:hypothetical protein
MVELEHFHLASLGTAEFSNVLPLLQIQNAYIGQVYKLIYLLYNDFNVANQANFQEFAGHFNSFAQYHASSDGFSKALDAVQVYHYALLEKLLDSHIVVAAEHLELAIDHLEHVVEAQRLHANAQLLLLNQGMNLLEENQLKILESLETLIASYRRNQLQN